MASSKVLSNIPCLLFLGAILIATVIGCGRQTSQNPQTPTSTASKDAASESVDGDWLIRNMPAEPKTLNPVTARDLYEVVVNRNVYEALLRRNNETLELEAELAESYIISDDHLTYTFKLKQGVKFHDGAPMTARDVAFTFERIKDPKVDAAHLRNYFRDIDRVEVIDDYTVRFVCTQPYWKALEVVGTFAIMPQHIFERGDFNSHPNDRHPVGTGPYKFVKWDTGRKIVLERNENYWGKRCHLDRVVFKIVTEDTVALQLFKRGELDLLGLSPEQWVRQAGSPEFEQRARKLTYYLPSFNYIGWNMRRPYFQDKRVRRALTELVDRETILQKLLYGLGKIVTGDWYINGPIYDHAIQPWPYNVAEAERLLNESGWVDHDGDGIRDKDGVPFSFEFLIVPGSTFSDQLATILQEDLKKVGIRMTIRPLEWATFEQQVQDRKFDAVAMGWSLDVEGDPFQLWHSSQAEKGSNYVGFVNAEADEIIEKGRREFDAEKRRTMYRRLHTILHEEQPYTFMFCPQALVVVDRRFENVKVYPLGLDPKEWYVPKAKQKYGRESNVP